MAFLGRHYEPRRAKKPRAFNIFVGVVYVWRRGCRAVLPLERRFLGTADAFAEADVHPLADSSQERGDAAQVSRRQGRPFLLIDRRHMPSSGATVSSATRYWLICSTLCAPRTNWRATPAGSYTPTSPCKTAAVRNAGSNSFSSRRRALSSAHKRHSRFANHNTS